MSDKDRAEAPLGVGIIGASARGGWAKVSHVPAVKATPGLVLAAVAGRSQASADAAARAFGAAKAHGEARALIGDPSVDIVAVCVKAPDHRELVLAALAAGKHVYCEWPLGRSTLEAEELARAARDAVVCATVGLQARANPSANRAREIVASGELGRVLSVRVLSTTAAWGRVVAEDEQYAEDPDNGVSLVTVQGAHTIDVATFIAGRLDSLSALSTVQFPEIRVGGAGETRVRRNADHLLLQARLASGAALGIEVAGGRPADETPFRLDVTGDKASLRLEGGAARGFQSASLRVTVDGKAVSIGNHGALAELDEAAINVAATYALLRDDIRHGTRRATDFEHAVWLSKVVDEILTSARGRG